jgi:hypothetical protein
MKPLKERASLSASQKDVFVIRKVGSRTYWNRVSQAFGNRNGSVDASGWNGSFYPRGMKPSDDLGFYADRFHTVEVDSTFYACFTARTVENWNARTPVGFVFGQSSSDHHARQSARGLRSRNCRVSGKISRQDILQL